MSSDQITLKIGVTTLQGRDGKGLEVKYTVNGKVGDDIIVYSNQTHLNLVINASGYPLYLTESSRGGDLAKKRLYPKKIPMPGDKNRGIDQGLFRVDVRKDFSEVLSKERYKGSKRFELYYQCGLQPRMGGRLSLIVVPRSVDFITRTVGELTYKPNFLRTVPSIKRSGEKKKSLVKKAWLMGDGSGKLIQVLNYKGSSEGYDEERKLGQSSVMDIKQELQARGASLLVGSSTGADRRVRFDAGKHEAELLDLVFHPNYGFLGENRAFALCWCSMGGGSSTYLVLDLSVEMEGALVRARGARSKTFSRPLYETFRSLGKIDSARLCFANESELVLALISPKASETSLLPCSIVKINVSSSARRERVEGEGEEEEEEEIARNEVTTTDERWFVPSFLDSMGGISVIADKRKATGEKGESLLELFSVKDSKGLGGSRKDVEARNGAGNENNNNNNKGNAGAPAPVPSHDFFSEDSSKAAYGLKKEAFYRSLGLSGAFWSDKKNGWNFFVVVDPRGSLSALIPSAEGKHWMSAWETSPSSADQEIFVPYLLERGDESASTLFMVAQNGEGKARLYSLELNVTNWTAF